MLYMPLSRQFCTSFASSAASLRAVQCPGLRTSAFTPNRLIHNSISMTFSRSSSMPLVSLASNVKKRAAPWRYRRFYQAAGFAGLGLSLSLFNPFGSVHCEPVPMSRLSEAPLPQQDLPSDDDVPPAPQSSVNLYELSFGTVCGVCAGVFVKKGAKMAAFVLGGVFVLLQYLVSLHLVRVNWARMEQGFQKLFYSADAQGVRRPPSLGSLFRWIVDFLTADFQARASFVAGFLLGLRIG